MGYEFAGRTQLGPIDPLPANGLLPLIRTILVQTAEELSDQWLRAVSLFLPNPNGLCYVLANDRRRVLSKKNDRRRVSNKLRNPARTEALKHRATATNTRTIIHTELQALE